MDIKAGEDRALLRARLDLGQADERDALGGQAVDVELVVEPGSRRPVELDVRGRQEDAAAVGHGYVLELRFAEDRPVDPTDADTQARRGFDTGDAIDKPAMPGRTVEQHKHSGD